MPTYTVSSFAGTLNDDQKQALASAITRAHHEATGAQTFFAQVVFHTIPRGDWFVGGQRVDGQQLFINGQVRAGRPKDVKLGLLKELARVACRCTDFDSNKVWVYLNELPPSNMVEYGYVLPEPGAEHQWLETLSAKDRELMMSLKPAGAEPKPAH